MMGLCALILLVVPTAAQAQQQTNLGAQLTHHLKTMKRSTQVIRFFDHHRWLLSDPRFAAEANRQLALHRTRLARAQAKAADAKAALRRRAQTRRLAGLRSASPRDAICTVFGRYCRQALQVARCESGLTTTAQNGQYLGLFQMGSSERRLFGHGATAIEQVRAAHAYFVRSGRSWGPWSCKPWS